METTVRNIGNSKGIIIPKFFIEKFNFKDKVEIEERSDGIFIKKIEEQSLFQQKLTAVKSNKYKIYNNMRQVAESDETIDYYKNLAKENDDIDLEIIES